MTMTKVKPFRLCIFALVILFSTSYAAHAQQTTSTMPLSEVPITIFAVGDIAKCDGEDAWWEEFQELVGILPEDSGRVRGEEVTEEPFLEELLELVGWSEETGDYASAAETATLLQGQRGSILALGDLAYEKGSARSFKECYDRTWGPLKDRTYPVPGNHEYKTKNAAPYFSYWGSRAGEAGKGYYSFDLAGWHLIALNSKLEKKNPTDTISAQHAWLKRDLAATNARCILAYWHHPVFSSGQHEGSPRMKNLLQTLYARGVSVMLKGHAHDYERFALQNAEGRIDPARGFRAFVVGTGGAPLRPLETRQKNSEFFQAATFGVLKLELYSDRYAWAFLPVGGTPPLDTGTGSCVLPKKG